MVITTNQPIQRSINVEIAYDPDNHFIHSFNSHWRPTVYQILSRRGKKKWKKQCFLSSSSQYICGKKLQISDYSTVVSIMIMNARGYQSTWEKQNKAVTPALERSLLRENDICGVIYWEHCMPLRAQTEVGLPGFKSSIKHQKQCVDKLLTSALLIILKNLKISVL